MNRSISCLLVSHREKTIVNVTFPNCRFYDALANNLCFNVGHKNVCKSNGHFCAHGSTVDLEVVPSIELKGILSVSISLRYGVGIGGLLLQKNIVCFVDSLKHDPFVN